MEPGAWKAWLRLGVALAVVTAAIVLIAFVPIGKLLQDFLEYVRTMGPWGPVALGLAYVAMCVLFVPGSILTMGAGFAFGVVTGSATVSVSSTIGATLAFLLGRTLARPWIEAKVAANPRFSAVDRAVEAQGFKIVLLMRLSPIFPFSLMNYAFGVTGVPLWKYVLASWLGMFPGTVMYVYLGSAVRNVADIAAGRAATGTGPRVLFVLGLAATIATAWLVARAARRAIREVVPDPVPHPTQEVAP